MLNKISDISKSAVYLNYFRLLNLKDYQAPSNDEVVARHLEEIREKGFVVIENFFDEEKCAEIRNEIDQIIAENPDRVWKDPQDADNRIWGVNLVSEQIRNDFFESDFIRQVTTGFYKSKSQFFLSMANRIKALEENLGSGGGWHRDSVHMKQIKSILYLNDVNEEGGPFQYIEGTQDYQSVFDTILKSGISFAQNRFSEDEIGSIMESGNGNYKLHNLTAKAGSLVLADTFGIHRGMPIQKGMRYAITNYFYPGHMDMSKMVHKYQPMIA